MRGPVLLPHLPQRGPTSSFMPSESSIASAGLNRQGNVGQLYRWIPRGTPYTLEKGRPSSKGEGVCRDETDQRPQGPPTSKQPGQGLPTTLPDHPQDTS